MRAPRPLHPLPLPRPYPDARQRRRHIVAGHDLDRRRIERLQALAVERIGARLELDEDSLASAARQLMNHRGPARLAPCISERLRCGAAMAMMIEDRQWQSDDKVQALCRTIVEHIRSNDDLFADIDSPALQHFGDAILVDAAWDGTAGEVVVYCDYRRLRLLEAELRGMRWSRFHFDRRDYEDARLAERELLRTMRRIGLGHYVEPPRGDSGPLIH
jgi:hypothetical protein